MDQLKQRLLTKVNPYTGTTMAESTANQYIRYIKNIGATDLSFLKDTEKVLAIIKEKYAESTAASVLNALSVCCDVSYGYKKLAKFYKAQFKQRIKPINKQREQGQKTEKQKENWLDWTEVIRRRDELDGIDKILLSLYIDIPPRRAADFGTMEINSQTGNSFETRTGKFIFRFFKTASTYGEQVIDVPDDLYIMIMDYLKGRKDGKLLPFSTVSITKHLNSIFKPKKISVSALRHIYLTHHYGSIKEGMKQIANQMAHSSTMQGQYIVN